MIIVCPIKRDPAHDADSFEQRYIVEFNTDVNFEEKLRDIENKHKFKSDKKYMFSRIKGFSASLKGKQVRDLMNEKDIRSIEKDEIISTNMYGDPIIIDVSDSFANEIIEAKQTEWNQVLTNTVPIVGDDFSTVHCFVIDTGINPNHSEFLAGQVTLDYNAITGQFNSADDNGHGTAVASLVSGIKLGTASKVKLHSIKVLDKNGSGYTSTIISALNWITIHRPFGPVVINMSVGGNKSSSLNSAVQSCIDLGMIVVAAAGNSGADACTFSPASVTGAITVAAHDKLLNKPSWSNYGICIDIFGPGVSIKAAWLSNTAYATVSGTSFSSPIVAGIVARYLNSIPNGSIKDVNDYLNRSDIEQEIIGAGTGSPNRRVYWNKDKILPGCT